MFQKMVAIEPTSMVDEHMERLRKYAREFVEYDDIPVGDEEIIRRIGDADAVLLRHNTHIGESVLRACPNVRYIGMCCSLYAPENANVDILTAKELGIVVKGIRDYGDEGVPEYVISELVRFLHGFGDSPMWRDQPLELTGIPVGIVGLGTTGIMIARALRFFGADVHYYSRSRKPEQEAGGLSYLPLDELLQKVDILCCCLNKNVILLGEREFELFGSGKILMNTSIGPSHEIAALEKWLRNPENHVFCDMDRGIDPTGALLSLPNVHCTNKSAGMTSLASYRLGEKALENIEAFLIVPRKESGERGLPL